VTKTIVVKNAQPFSCINKRLIRSLT